MCVNSVKVEILRQFFIYIFNFFYNLIEIVHLFVEDPPIMCRILLQKSLNSLPLFDVVCG
jgi:hypothetical protein